MQTTDFYGAFKSAGLESFSPGAYPCSCGKTHALDTAVAFGRGALERLPDLIERAAGKLVKILLVSDSLVWDMYGKRAADVLGAAGYRCDTHIYTARVLPSVLNADALRGYINEDCKLILGIGGGSIADIVKFAATKYKLPYALAATSPSQAGFLTPFASLSNFGLPESFVTKAPDALVFDTDILSGVPVQLIASGYGELIACSLSLLDWQAAAVMNGEEYCPSAASLAAEIISETDGLSDGLLKKDRNAYAALAEKQLKLSLLGQAALSSRLLNSSPHQCGAALSLLKARRNHASRLTGEHTFLFACVLAGLYTDFLSKPAAHSLPAPDNVTRLERISDSFNSDEIVAASKLSALLDAPGYELITHKLNVYRGDFLKQAQSISGLIARASKVFARLYSDAGFWIGRYLSEDDKNLILSLTPDVSAKYTLLSLMKDIGYLEQFL